MIQLTDTAVAKVNEILSQQEPKPKGLRLSVVGGGCSGFQYSMAFENQQLPLDKVFNYDGLRVFVDQASLLYLDNCRGRLRGDHGGGRVQVRKPERHLDLRLRKLVQRLARRVDVLDPRFGWPKRGIAGGLGLQVSG